MAKAGHQRAAEELAERYWPLVYNIVGLGLGGGPELDRALRRAVERIQQEAPHLADPTSVRAWAAGTALRQVRQARRPGRAGRAGTAGHVAAAVDPDFAATAIARLKLDGQARQLVEATRWLSAYDRQVLPIWWLSQTGELDTDEVTRALELSAEETAVRVTRLRTRLENAREVVAALAAHPTCPDLADAAGVSVGGRGPAPYRRDQLVRHTRACVRCAGHRITLAPVAELLAGVGLVPPPDLSTYRTPVATTATAPAMLATPSAIALAAAPPAPDPLLSKPLGSNRVGSDTVGPDSLVSNSVGPEPAGAPVRRFPAANLPPRQLVLLGLAVSVLGAAAVIALLPARDASPPPAGQPLSPPPVAQPSGPVVPGATPGALSPSPSVSVPMAAQRPKPSATGRRPAAPPPPRKPFHVSYEAEAARRYGDAEVVFLPAASGGKIVQRLGTERQRSYHQGGWYQWFGGPQGGHQSYRRSGAIEFTANVPVAGRYELTIFYVSGERRDAYLSVNGASPRRLSFPGQGRWDTVHAARLRIELAPGRNSIALGNPWDRMPRLDRIRLAE